MNLCYGVNCCIYCVGVINQFQFFIIVQFEGIEVDFVQCFNVVDNICWMIVVNLIVGFNFVVNQVVYQLLDWCIQYFIFDIL